MKVAILGAHGKVGTALREELGDDPGHEFTYVDVEDHPDVETVIADMRDSDAVRDALAGHDAAVYLSFDTALNWTVTDVEWTPVLRDNLLGMVTAYGAAIEAGVDSFLFASSIHVVGGYERELRPDLYDPDHGLRLDREDPVRPNSMYAVAKLFGEALGRFAADSHDLSVYCLRLGLVTPRGRDHPYYVAETKAEAGEVERGSEAYDAWVGHGRALWLSHRDLADLVASCLRDDAVDFDVFYGISDNAAGWLDIDHARERVGYEPADDGSTWERPPE